MARNWASREASNMERMDSLSSSFMEGSFAWDKRQNAMLRSVCQYERNIDRTHLGGDDGLNATSIDWRSKQSWWKM